MFCATVMCGKSASFWNTMEVGRSGGRNACHILPLDADRARRRVLEACDLLQQRGLAAA